MTTPRITDLGKARRMFREFGIGFAEHKDVDGFYTQLTLEALEQDKVKGYAGFVADFTFDETGKFVDVGIWE